MTENGNLQPSFDVNFWVSLWEEKNTPWHKEDVNPLLIKYIDLLDGGRRNLRVFVPLCGKSLDMKWLCDQGHHVVGVDACQMAILDFFKENSLEYTSDMRNGLSVFREKSGQLVLYCCDIYDFHKSCEGSFDAIWDRGSLAAVNPEDRTRYLALVTSLKTASCRHLIELCDYDDSLYQRFPFSIPMSKVLELFGERFDVKLIETQDFPEFGQSRQIDFKWFHKNLFLATQK